jgi:hypothetical protein
MIDLERTRKSSHFKLASSLLSITPMLRAGLFASIVFTFFECTSGDAPPPNNTNGQQCMDPLTITGTFVQSTPPPIEPDGSAWTGCWPIGKWTFSAMLSGTNACSDTPMIASSYSFTGTEGSDEDGDPTQNFAYSDPSALVIVKVSAAGNGDCEGEVDLFSTDGLKEWNMTPWLAPDNTITGEGFYAEWGSDQWVGSDDGD